MFIEDSQADAELAVRELRRGFEPLAWERVETNAQLRAALETAGWDVVLCDNRLPGFSGPEALKIVKACDPELPVILLSGTIGEEAAVEALKGGVDDYILKDNLARLLPAVERQLREAAERRTKKWAEQALRESEERFRQLAENIDAFFYLTDPQNTKIFYASPAYEVIWGRSLRSLYENPHSWFDAVHPEDRDYVSERMDRTVSGPTERQYRIVRPDGALRWVRSRGFPVPDQAGVTYRIAGIVEDVTDHVRLQDELREREAGLRHAQLMAKLAHVITGPDGSFETWSDTLPQLIGVEPAELARSTRAGLDIVHPEDRELFRAKAIEAGVKRTRTELEYRLRRADGAWIHVRQTMEPLQGEPDAEGRLRWFNTLQDVSEQKRAERRIARLNRVHAVLSGINSLIVRVRDRDELYREACRIAVEDGKFPMAWIGTVDRPAARIRPVAWKGGDREYIEAMPLALGLDEAVAQRYGLAPRAVAERRAMIANDMTNDPRVLLRSEAGQHGFRSFVVLPLMVAGEAVGVLALYANEAGFFDDEEMRLLLELAGDISFAMAHIDKEEKLKRLQRVNAVLSSVNAAIVRIRDRQALFRESCRIAVEAGQLRLAWIGIVDWRTEKIAPVAFSGPEQGFLGIIRLSTRRDSGQFGMAGRAVSDRTPVVSNDVLADEQAARREQSAQRGFRSVAMIPLLVDGAVAGVLGLHAAETGFFDEDEMKLVREIAGNIAFALEHIDKEEKVRRLTRVHAVLSGINAAIVRIRDRQELYREACRVAVEAGRFPLAWIAAVDLRDQLVKAVAWAGDEGGFVQLVRPTVGATGAGKAGLSAKAIDSRKPVICNDIEADGSAMRYAKEALERGYRSAVALPLEVEGTAIGALVLYSAEARFFDDDEMRLLNELAGDISFALEHIENTAKLDYLAYYDALTGLANRTLFHERVEQHVAAAGKAQRKCAVFFLDVDRFKTVNDAFGRQAGDALLKQLAERFVAASGGAERIARFGADHFAVVAPEVQSEDQIARLSASRLDACFGPPFRVGERELRVSAKVGIAVFPADGADAETLFKNAEAALKKAKAGGEKYLFYAQQMTERVAEKLSLESRLRKALEKEEFVLHYQPKVDLDARRVVGAEALIRWQSPELGLVPPIKFIGLLEETGLILEVGSWALKRAALDHRAWVEAKLEPPRVAVNVSAIQLRQRDFVDIVERAIMEGVAPVGIDLEITESLIMQDVEVTIGKLKKLRELGIKIAVDDFGTGYSSLAYLAKLPVETLKIDRSFVIRMLEDPDTTTLVQTMISLAHSLRLNVVAEGVDSEEQAKILRLLRCDQMQGYLFSKPLPRDGMTTLLQESASVVGKP